MHELRQLHPTLLPIVWDFWRNCFFWWDISRGFPWCPMCHVIFKRPLLVSKRPHLKYTPLKWCAGVQLPSIPKKIFTKKNESESEFYRKFAWVWISIWLTNRFLNEPTLLTENLTTSMKLKFSSSISWSGQKSTIQASPQKTPDIDMSDMCICLKRYLK